MSETINGLIIKLVFCDEENNGFVTLGGAGFDTKQEWEHAWSSIPRAIDGWDNKDALCADKLDHNLDQVDERPITAAVAERLLGKPIAALIEEGRASTIFTCRQFLENEDLATLPS
jgi:hypothetical protein